MPCDAIEYWKPLLQVPVNCDGCSASFDLSHVLPRMLSGGLVTPMICLVWCGAM